MSVEALIIEQVHELQRERGQAMMFITHNLCVVRNIARDVVVLRAGRVVEQWPMATVLVQPPQPNARRLLADLPTADGLALARWDSPPGRRHLPVSSMRGSAEPVERVILCYGDSNTHGYDARTGNRYPAPVRWPGVMRSALGDGYIVLEEALNGRTTIWEDPFTEGRNGLGYLTPCLRSHAPIDLVVLMLGTNDLKSIFRLQAPEIASGVARLVEVISLSGCGPGGASPKSLLIVPPPLGDATSRSALWGLANGAERSRQLVDHYRLVASLASCDLLDAADHASVGAFDGIHLDEGGHRSLGLAVAGRCRQMLDSAA